VTSSIALLGAVPLVAAGSILPLLLRCESLRMCLPAPAPRRAILGWTAAGFALNQLVGFRSGDVLRVALASEHCGVARGILAVVLLRAAELGAMLLFCASFTASRLHGAASWAAAGIAALAALALAPRLAARLPALPLLDDLARLGAKRLAALLSVSLLAYAAEALLVLGVARALGEELGCLEAAFLLAASLVGQLAAFLPANAGTFEASVAGALALLGRSGPVLWLLPLWVHAARLGASICLLPLAVAHLPLLRRPRHG
jgi:hypothetical protein